MIVGPRRSGERWLLHDSGSPGDSASKSRGQHCTSLAKECAMLAMTYRGPYRVRVTQKPDPQIEHPRDAIVRVTRACICGSDLHLYHGLIPDTRVGHTFGHEFVGVVEQVGPDV